MSDLRDYLDTLDEPVLLLEPEAMDVAILGLVSRVGASPVLCYDTRRIIDVLVAEGMDEDAAEEFFHFNIAEAYMGEGTPVFLTPLPV